MRVLRLAQCSTGIAVILANSAIGQGFINLDFESATIRRIDPNIPILLNWGLAVPGWTNNLGSQEIFWQTGPAGASPIFLLADSTTSLTPLAGNFSIRIGSGWFDWDQGTPSIWVDAAMWQTGMIPSSAQTLRMLAVGPFKVTINGMDISMSSLGENVYAGDISSFAGSVAQLAIISGANVGQVWGGPMIDNIEFSSQPIPEPGSLALFAVGAVLTGALWLLRRAKGCPGV